MTAARAVGGDTGSGGGDSSSEDPVCALVDASQAEHARRTLDRAGFLGSRAFRTPDGRIAMPLSEAGAQTLTDELASSMGVRILELSRLPLTGRGAGDLHARLHSSALRALEAAGVPAVAALEALPASAMPHRWEKLGDVVLFAPVGCFAPDSAVASLAASAQHALWSCLAVALGAARLGVQGRIAQEGEAAAALQLQRAGAHVLQRKSGARLLWPEGADGWTEHRCNGIVYGLDVRCSMFSSGNGTEKARVASLRCEGETVVDLYAGIGYFTLPYLVHARAAHLHACEWDGDALAALRRNLVGNGVAADRYTVHPGDNAASAAAFAGVAHRVNLGLIPSSEAGWPVAVAALRPEGGWLHVHANVGSAEADEAAWSEALLCTLRRHAEAAGRQWDLSLVHLERVKWYAPRVRHVVADVMATPAMS